MHSCQLIACSWAWGRNESRQQINKKMVSCWLRHASQGLGAGKGTSGKSTEAHQTCQLCCASPQPGQGEVSKKSEGSHLLCPEGLGGNGNQRPVNRNTSGREREAWQSGAGPRLWWATARVLYNLPAWFHAWFCEWGVSGATCLWSVGTTSPGFFQHLLVELVDHHHLISGGGPKEVWT